MTHLECSLTGELYEAGQVHNLSRAGRPLLARYDLDAARRTLTRDSLAARVPGIPPYWKPMFELFATRVGDPRTEAGRTLLTKHSPLTYVERFCRPLLIGQGANDPRVKQAESDQIVQALQAKGIPVAYVLYPDEGHGFARPENDLSFYAIAEAFLAKHLGGRYQLIGSDFQDSSLQVLQGVSEVPGLPEAWVEFTQKKAKSG